MIDREDLRARLQSLKPVRLTEAGRGAAAILLAVKWIADLPHFVLTRRTETVATHKGQISFPGGVREPEDENLIRTALRETEEEVGIRPPDIDVLGEFNDYSAVTGHTVRTVVGVVESGAVYAPHPGEVAYILEIPVDFFETTEPEIQFRLHQGTRREVYFYHYGNETVWGLTARIIRDFVLFSREVSECAEKHRDWRSAGG